MFFYKPGVTAARIKRARGAVAGLAGDHSPRRRAVETHRSTLFPALPGSFRPVLGSGVVSAACVIHLGSKRGSGLLGVTCAAKGAGVRGGDIAGERCRGS